MLPFRRDLVLQCLLSGAEVEDTLPCSCSLETPSPSSEELFQLQEIVADHRGQRIQRGGLE